MSAHTPGPWSVQPCAADHGESTVIGTADGFLIARIPSDAWSGIGAESKEDSANARLIAAAPDMLAALEAMINHRSCDYLDNTPLPYAACVAAIAKAKV